MPSNTSRLGLTFSVGDDPTNVPGDEQRLALQLDSVTSDSTAMMAYASGGATLPSTIGNGGGRLYYDGNQLWFDTGTGYISIGGGIPVGGFLLWSTVNPPANYAQCNGVSVPATLVDGSMPQSVSNGMPTLYAIIGTTYGGGGGFFSLPDFTDNFPVGIGDLYNINSQGGSTAYSNSYNVPLLQHGHPGSTASVSGTTSIHSHTMEDQAGRTILATTLGGDAANRYLTAGSTTTGTYVNVPESSQSIATAGGLPVSSSGSATIAETGDVDPQIDLDIPTVPPYLGVNFVIRFQ